MSESEFWRCTPRKLMALRDVHVEVITPTDPKKKQRDAPVYIDQLRW